MKKKSKILLSVLALSFIALSTYAQINVKTKPSRPSASTTRPDKPSPKHVWIDEDWLVSDKDQTYVWHGGYWVKPPRAEAVWVAGHWDESKDGWKWTPGYWK